MHQLRLQRRSLRSRWRLCRLTDAACPLRVVSALYGTIQRQEGAGAPRHSPDVSLRGAKRRGNLGKALPIYTECRRTQSLSNLTVAALSERHGGLQYAPHCPMAQGYQICHCEERSDVAISQNPTGQQGSHRRNRNCLPEIATAPLGPRNDKLGSLAPQNVCRKDCQTAWRSLSAATFFSRAAALCSERRCRPRRGRFPLYRRPVRVGSIAPGPAVRSPAMITPSGPPA